jgi:hypothetical protein
MELLGETDSGLAEAQKLLEQVCHDDIELDDYVVNDRIY